MISKRLKVGFDIDDTLAGFQISYLNRFGKTPDHIITWNCENKLRYDKEFWTTLPLLRRPDFEFTLYCTKRVNPKSYTKEWIRSNNLPDVPVYQQICQCASKAPMIKGRVDVFIEDSVSNFLDLNKKGIPCLLMDTPENKDWGPIGRIYSLNYDEIEDTYELFKFTMFDELKCLI